MNIMFDPTKPVHEEFNKLQKQKAKKLLKEWKLEKKRLPVTGILLTTSGYLSQTFENLSKSINRKIMVRGI